MQTDEILAQLTEMFGDYMDQTRIATAVLCNKDLESCIEFLLKEDVQPVQNPASTGAIKKTVAAKPATDFASFLKSGQNQNFGALPQPQRAVNGVRRGDEYPPNFAEIVEMISKGFRVMVLMRGPPGSGKSHLSRALVDKTLGNSDYRNHVFGADDYFLVNGVYKFQPDRLDDAHRFNQNNVRAKAVAGWSPIIVDNTNMRHWEMHAYVEIAAENGYIVQILEPVTHWRKSARALAARNVHGVPEAKIKTMLLNYERLKDVSELYRQCKLDHALDCPPKMRHYPIVKEDLLDKPDSEEAPIWTSTDDWEASNDGVPSNSPEVDLAEIPIPKPPRQTPTHQPTAGSARPQDYILIFNDHDNEEWSLPVVNEDTWKRYDEESSKFWTETDTEGQLAAARCMELPAPAAAGDQKSFLLSNVTIPTEWKTPPEVTPVKEKRKKSDKKRIALVRHKRGCENENSSFSEICNLYPHVPASYLWDLFEKCNGDGDWTANLLLEDQNVQEFSEESNADADSMAAIGSKRTNVLDCNCNEPVAVAPAAQVVSGDDTDRSSAVSSPRSTMRKKDKRTDLPEDVQLARKKLESLVVLPKQHYSKKIQRVRVAHGIIRKEEIEEREMEEGAGGSDDVVNSDPEVFEVTLGVVLIRQLHEIFKVKHSTKSFSIDDLTEERTKVFIPSEMAEQIYLSFMDSVYSCREEEKLVTLKRDAQIAKQMDVKERYPQLFSENLNNSDTPNLADIIEMENALKAYRNEMNGWTEEAPSDWAAQMTRQKLAEMYPSVDEDVLAEILHAHDNKFNDTVTVLNNSIPEKLRNQIAREREALLKRTEPNPVVPPPPPPPSGLEQSISGEEAINLHLKTAEECRNLAQHHQDLKNECHEKARNAIQRGIAGVAEYYAQIARLHRTKIDLYNSKASNAIMEVHKLTLNNADVLDLHYLHSEEALRCLEIFLAEHARKLRTRQQQYKELFIITGRGLHSADGIPIIKHRVKAMLRDLGLRSVELNPGFLKIKVYNNPDVLERLLVPQC